MQTMHKFASKPAVKLFASSLILALIHLALQRVSRPHSSSSLVPTTPASVVPAAAGPSRRISFSVPERVPAAVIRMKRIPTWSETLGIPSASLAPSLQTGLAPSLQTSLAPSLQTRPPPKPMLIRTIPEYATKIAALTAAGLQCPLKFIQKLGGARQAAKMCEHDGAIFRYITEAIRISGDALAEHGEAFWTSLGRFTLESKKRGLHARYLRDPAELDHLLPPAPL